MKRAAGPDRPRRSAFLGGLSYPTGPISSVTIGFGFVTLSVTAEAVRIRASNRVFRVMAFGLIRDFEFPVSEITTVERIIRLGPFPAPGVRFRLVYEHRGPIFWTLRPGRVLDALDCHGVPVDRSAHAASIFTL